MVGTSVHTVLYLLVHETTSYTPIEYLCDLHIPNHISDSYTCFNLTAAEIW